MEWTSTAACKINVSPGLLPQQLIAWAIGLDPVSVLPNDDDARPRSVLRTESTNQRPSNGSKTDSKALYAEIDHKGWAGCVDHGK